jgi:hypothetical protein
MSAPRLTIEVDNENECYRLLTDAALIRTEDYDERILVAVVFEWKDATRITQLWNGDALTGEGEGV